MLRPMSPPSYRASHRIPPRAGVGLKPEHAADIFESARGVAFFEVHAENYMGDGGAPHALLSQIRDRFPLSLHGVGLSIGGAKPLCREHLGRLQRLVALYKPGLFSEHLAWSSHGDVYLNDLLPLPYNETTLARVAVACRPGAEGARRAHAAGEPLDLRRLRGIDDERDGVPLRGRGAHRLRRCCSTSTTCTSPPQTTASDPFEYLECFPLGGGRRDSSRRPRRGARRRRRPAPDQFARRPGRRYGLGPLRARDRTRRPGADAHRMGQRCSRLSPRLPRKPRAPTP